MVHDFCWLVDRMVGDIRFLEEKIVRIRYKLSWHLEEPHGEFLRCDILSNLAGRYYDDPAYQIYMKLLYDNHDPMESKKRGRRIRKLARGHDNSGDW
jgi:hypothetical protein